MSKQDRIPDRKANQFVLHDRPNAPRPTKRTYARLIEHDDPNAEYALSGVSISGTAVLPIERTEEQVEMMWAYKRLMGQGQ